MFRQSKVYVIEPADRKARVESSSSKGGKEQSGNFGSPGDGNGSAGMPTGRTDSGLPGGILILSYLAGPLFLLAISMGRRSRFWSWLSVSSVILTAIVMSMWIKLSPLPDRETSAGAVLLFLAMAAVMLCFLVWTRAALLAGRYEDRALRRLPGWVRMPLTAGFLGIICPGLGLFVAGHPKHAAAALWMTCMAAVSLLLLSRASWLWGFNAYAGAFALEPETLEGVFICAGAAAVMGGLAWVVQALNGMRLAGCSSDRNSASGRNWAAVTLLASIIAFSIFFRPAVVADALDRSAETVSSKGMKIIPLHLSLAAMRLDQSRPEYAIRIIGLYEDLGDQAAADMMRRELVDKLKKSVPFLEEEGLVVLRQQSAIMLPAMGTISTQTVPF